MGIDLSIIWFVIIVFATLMYIVMDGFDLGIGILFPFHKHDVDRDTMMNTVAPVWDGNETRMVLGERHCTARFLWLTLLSLMLLVFRLPQCYLGLSFVVWPSSFVLKQSRNIDLSGTKHL